MQTHSLRLTPSPGWERAGVWDLSAWRRFLAPGIKILRRSVEKMRCVVGRGPGPPPAPPPTPAPRGPPPPTRELFFYHQGPCPLHPAFPPPPPPPAAAGVP